MYDNKYKEKPRTPGSELQKENFHPNSHQGEEIRKDQKKLEKIAKFNNSRLFNKKLPERENTFTPFKVENSGKESTRNGSDLKESVLSKHFPVFDKNKEGLNSSNIDLTSSQISRRVTVDPNMFSSVNSIQPLDKRMSLNSPASMNFGLAPSEIFPDFAGLKPAEVNIEKIPELCASTQTEIIEEEIVKQVEPKKKEIPFSYVVITFLVLVLTGACFFSFSKENKTMVFCNNEAILSESSGTCTPCPLSAICQNGGMVTKFLIYH